MRFDQYLISPVLGDIKCLKLDFLFGGKTDGMIERAKG
tara:strand:+ start:5586 stop:5699 length:114 start_codon:yes stop_codon:yes gene_type:complete